MSQLKNEVENAESISSLYEEAYKIKSPWRVALRRFLQHRMALVGGLMMGIVVIFVIGGAFFYAEAEGNKTDLFNITAPPSREHPFGTDLVGRDIFIRAIYGGQISIAIGITSASLSIIIGTVVGVVGGYFGGWIDAILSRITEALLSIPVLILLLVLSSVLAKNVSTVNVLGRTLSSTVIIIVVLIGLTSWMALSRIVRAQVLSLREQEFVLAARSLGAGHGHIIFRHLLPNLVAPIVVTATLGTSLAIITEAYLSFLGFGVQPPTATWGNILTGAQDRIDTVWWMWMAPGFFIIVSVLAINFIGDGLRDALDPRSIR
jgi:peptide/nickel transport system permease protein